jgi:ceramide glucosyltransferase
MMKTSVIESSSCGNSSPLMDMLAFACFAFTAIAFACHIISCALALLRCRPRTTHVKPAIRPPVTLVRPVCGLEHFSGETLRSTFEIDYPDYEVIFCVADDADPIVPLVHAILAEHPERSARLLTGQDMLGDNPKLNNMAKGFHNARFDHIVFVDSNVFTPPDYLDQLICALETGPCMVSAPPIGLAPQGFWADVECAFLNSYQARFQYAVDTLGMGFAQGKTLFFRRETLENGGLARLVSEPAEDAAATKLIRSKGGRVRLAGPFPQLIGPRALSQIWKRQLRWARLRRATFPVHYAAEMLAGPLPPLLAFMLGAYLTGMDSAGLIPIFLAVWYVPEWALMRAAGWPRVGLAMIIRDLMLPVLFIAGAAGRNVEWHGHRMGSPAGPSSQLSRWKDRLRLSS